MEKIVQINHRHERDVRNENGLDIKYTLDLTKICMKPNVHGLRVIERLTGVDLGDIISGLPGSGVDGEAVDMTVFHFAVQCIQVDGDEWCAIDHLYQAYLAFIASSERRVTRQQFCVEFRKCFPDVVRCRSSKDGRPWGYRGVRIISDLGLDLP